MKQLLQNLKTGNTELTEVPTPQTISGHLSIQSAVSLISTGTERMLVDFGRASYLQKAKQQPEKVRQVLDKIKTDGLLPTIDAVQSQLDRPIPLGYCNAGKVLNLPLPPSKGGMKIGDRVVSNGPHAEVVRVPYNLCAKIPDSVTDEEAAFTVIASIGLQGARLAQPTLGECFVVTGLGLVGLLTVQILRANGCRVLGIDLDSRKCELARQFGAEPVDLSQGEDPLQAALAFSHERGVDGVLITAATKSSEPVHQAAQMCRTRGRIVLVGVTGLELNRTDFYAKELSFQVSCSYGPGRYDPDYEELGHDYPIGFVRWTEQRNFEAVLDLMAAGKLNVKPLISHRFSFEDAEKAYTLIFQNTEPYIGILLQYQTHEHSKVLGEKTLPLRESSRSFAVNTSVVAGVIGAGNFASRTLLPALSQTSARLNTIASSGGVSGTHVGRKFGFEQSTTDTDAIFHDPEITTVFITTRHNTHARFVLQALNAGKHVFVEKPLCLTQEELGRIQEKIHTLSPSPLLLVGFNRRFAPHVVKIKSLLAPLREPKSFIMTVNAGYIAPEHWTQDFAVGGGRIIGEVCHFIDLLRFLA
ncbi:MAG: Gfo/Idh/MocA family oxidoreductase, partial [bacterium]|nr:Gfo/Idh/MocA family oxidoreductase [bacterium]